MTARTMAVGFLGAMVLLAGCGPAGVVFYDVNRVPTEECDILPQGEFCVTPDELSPPVLEVWAVERRGDEVRVFIDEEVWVGAPPRDGAAAGEVLAEKEEFVAVDPGPCTTTTTRTLEVFVTNDDITGTLRDKTRLDGPADCGDTPRGLRTTHRIDGVVAAAP